MSYQIAIDGPAGAGKSTIAKMVSKQLNFVYVDTGAMYRALGYYCMKENIPADNEEEVVKLCMGADVSIRYIDGEQVVVLNGENVNGVIRTPEVGNMASAVSVYKDVRAKMVDIQQKLAVTENVVMDGRDIASVVLPNANLKIYLDAAVEVRAKRRFDELSAKGECPSYETILEEVKDRDYRDMHRDNSPLVRVPEAVLVDSSYMTIEEVAAAICAEFDKVK
ncbi:MAG: (d)CMP kinase [Lachnospiraceae bacterium]|nr:(d)CMP kinase [Lachnospiraceae bacterium]